MKFFWVSLHPVKIQYSVANHSIFKEYFVEFAKFEEDDAVIALALNLPILSHSRCEVIPLFVGNV